MKKESKYSSESTKTAQTTKLLASDCPCTKKCKRHGDCFECIRIHRKNGLLTICMGLVAAKQHEISHQKFIKALARYKQYQPANTTADASHDTKKDL